MSDAEEVVRRSLELYHQGRLAQAEGLVGSGLREHPDDGPLWQLRGMIRQAGGDFEAARAALETASALVPLTPAARCALADCYARASEVELARMMYRHLATEGPCPTPLLPALAAGLGSIREDALALEVCRELSRREPARHEALFGMAFYMRRLGHPAEALVPPVARAHELAPRLTIYRALLASLLERIGRHEEAYELLRDVPPESIGCSGCLRRLMALFRAAGDHEKYSSYRDRARRIGEESE